MNKNESIPFLRPIIILYERIAFRPDVYTCIYAMKALISLYSRNKVTPSKQPPREER